MKLFYFKAEHYRPLKDFEIEVDDFMVLVGENNCGKSSFFYALELFLSNSVRGLNKEDFFNGETDQPIVLTAKFGNLNLFEKSKLSSWLVDEQLTVIKKYTYDDTEKVTVDHLVLTKSPQEPWLGPDFKEYNNRSVLSGLPIIEFLPPTGAINKTIFKKAIEQYIIERSIDIVYDEVWKVNPTGLKHALESCLPEFHLVKAVRDVTDESKTTSSSLFGKLLGMLVHRISKQNPSYVQLQEAISQINKIISGEAPKKKKMAELVNLEESLEKALSVWGEIKVSIDVGTPDVERLFQLGTSVMVDDGVQTQIGSKGHGLQRSFIFALMRVWAEENKQQSEAGTFTDYGRSNIFAFEEPEAFLHPQLCRATYDALKTLSVTEQILLCTHSSQFVRMEDYVNLALIVKTNKEESTRALRVREDLFEDDPLGKQQFNMIRFFNPDRNEVFFATKVILVEGPTEKAVFPVIAQRIGCFDHRVSLVDCSGKQNLRLYMKVLNAYRIPYFVVYDEDPIPPELEPGGSKHDPDKHAAAKHTFEENSLIEAECDPQTGTTCKIDGNLEKLLGISNSRADRIGKPYAAVERYLDKENPIPPKVQDMVKKAYSNKSGVPKAGELIGAVR